MQEYKRVPEEDMPTHSVKLGSDALQKTLSLEHPELTLREVGALLGISDRVAMLAERSGLKRLLRIFHDLKLTDVNSFLMADESLIDAVATHHASHAEEYSRARGWFPIKPQPATSQGYRILRHAVLSHAATRANGRRVPRVPILWRTSTESRSMQAGWAEAVAFVNGEAVFRSTRLAKTVCVAADDMPYAVPTIAKVCNEATKGMAAPVLFELLELTITYA